MRWNAKSGRRQVMWDINPPTADGGDALRETGGAAAGGGDGGGGGALSSSSMTLCCFDKDSSHRRVIACTVSGVLRIYNPSNGQIIRTVHLRSYLTDEPFRIVHLSNAHNSMKVIVVVTPREAVFLSEEIDLVTGLLPVAPYRVCDHQSRSPLRRCIQQQRWVTAVVR